MTRYLVVCDHGQCRSVAMATLLHERGHEAIPVSYQTFVDGYYLIQEWVDKIIRMDEGGSQRCLISNLEMDAWIGRDEWGNPCHPELLEKCKKKLEELGI